MNNKNKKELTIVNKIVIVLVCILINLLGRIVASRFQLPVWMDTIGTGVATCFLGIGGGLIVGVLSSIISIFMKWGSIAYLVTNIVVAVFQGLYMRKSAPDRISKAAKMGFWTGLLSIVAVVPVYMTMSGGRSENMWGDALFCLLEWNAMPTFVCCVGGVLIVEIVDKQLAAMLACGLYNVSRRIFRRGGKKSTAKLGTAVVVMCLVANGWEMSAITAQASNTSVKYVSTIYDNSSGLYSSEANDIAETEDGCIWIGSYAGLTRYDGKSFEFITDGGIVSVTAMMTDSKGRLWIGTNSGRVAVYDKDDFVFYGVSEGVNMNSVRCFAEKADGTIYIGTTGDMCKIDPSNTLHILDAGIQYVDSMVEKDGLMVGSTNDGNLFVMKDDVVTQVYANEDMYFTCVSKTTDKILAGTASSEIEEISIQDEQINIVNQVDVAPLSGIRAMEIDSDGRVWLAADSGCGYIEENKVKKIAASGFDSSVESVHEDYEGNIWFVSSRYGVLKLSKSIFGELFSEVGADAAVVNAVSYYGGAYYCGSDNGLTIIDKKQGKEKTHPLVELLKGARVRCIKTDSRNNLWLCTYSDNGLVRYSASGKITTFTEKDNGTTSDRFRCMIELADGSIVAGANNGINFIKGDTVTGTLTKQDGLQNPQILCLQEGADGTVYAGSDGAGIYIIKNQEIIGHIGEEEGLTSQVVMRITPYGEGFFVVSGDSISYMKDNVITPLPKFPYYNNYDAIVAGEKLCVLSSAGIYITDAGQLSRGEDISYKLYNYYDGLADGLTANSWNYLDEQGTLFFGTNVGVNYFNPNKLMTQQVEYKFGLSSVMYDGITVKAQEGVYYIPEDAKMITLEGSIRNYLCTNVKLRLFIKELTNQPTTVNHIELETLQISNLDHGQYTICMQVMSDDGSTVMQEQCYTLVKEAHIWEQPWYTFYLLTVGIWLGISVVWLIIDFGMSIKHDKEMEKIKYQAKGEFLTNMSHEFRTPVNTILGMNDIIMQEKPGDRITECAENIKQASVRLLNLINDVLDYSAIEAGKLEIIPERYFLENMLNNVIGFLKDSAAKKGIETEFVVDDNLPAKLLGDEGRVKQIIMNLLSNAVKYTKEGQIVFTVGGDIVKDKLRLHITVADTGIGISEDKQEQIFAEFDRLEFNEGRTIEGTGLGLSITNSLVKQMGGTISLQSVEGSGTVFHVMIPQKIIGTQKIGIYSYVPESENLRCIMNFTAPDARVLAVDDNRMNLSVISGLLKRNGISPDVAFGGEEALELCDKNKYDLIFMDHMMPYPDGIEVLHRIRSGDGINVKTPIVVLTANAVSGARKRYLEEGFDDYLSKPVDVEKLEEVLLKYLPMEMSVIEEVIDAKEEIPEKQSMEQEENALIIKEIGVKFCGGSEELYEEIIESYYEGSKKYRELLVQYYQEQNWKDYGMVAHTLKSTSMNIGAAGLSELAKTMEFAAKEQNIQELEANHEGLLQLLSQVLEELEKTLQKEDEGAVQHMQRPEYLEQLNGLLEYIRNYEMTMALETLEELQKVVVEGMDISLKELQQVEAAVNDFNYEDAEKLLIAYIKQCEV